MRSVCPPPFDTLLLAHALGVSRLLPRWLSWSFVTSLAVLCGPRSHAVLPLNKLTPEHVRQLGL